VDVKFVSLGFARTEAANHKSCAPRTATSPGLPSQHAHAVRQEQFRHGFARWAQFAHQRQCLHAALGDALALRTPPAPPEPEIPDEPGSTFGIRDFDIQAWSKKPRRLW